MTVQELTPILSGLPQDVEIKIPNTETAMTVGELKSLIADFPQDAEVEIPNEKNGYAGGISIATGGERVSLIESEASKTNDLAVEWAAFALARDVARSNGVELDPIKIDNIVQDREYQEYVSEFAEQIVAESRANPENATAYANKDSVDFIGYKDALAPARWAALAIARDELFTTNESKNIPLLNAGEMGETDAIQAKILKEARAFVSSTRGEEIGEDREPASQMSR